MTLLHVTPYFSPAWVFGGVPRAVTALARAQCAAGHSVLVLTTDALTPTSRMPVGEEMVDGVRVFRLRNWSHPARVRLNLSTPIRFRREARRLLAAHAVDLVHCHELRTIENLRLTALAHTPPLVVSPHGTLPYSTGRSKAKRMWDRLFSRRVLPRFSSIVALTPAEAADARALWTRYDVPLGDEQIAVVPNGVDGHLADSLPPRSDARKRWGLGDAPVVLFLGRLAERKGLLLLIAAFDAVSRKIPEARLLIAGPDEGTLEKAAAEVSARGLNKAVVWAGFLNGDDRLKALAAADVLVLPAIGEGFSMAVLEAMASGVPALVSPDCHVPEIAEAGSGLIVPLADDAWATAMIDILTDERRRREMGSRARRLALERFGWPQIASRLDAVYEAAIRVGR